MKWADRHVSRDGRVFRAAVSDFGTPTPGVPLVVHKNWWAERLTDEHLLALMPGWLEDWIQAGVPQWARELHPQDRPATG